MDIALSLVSHTNVGKTTLARTLLGRDIGEVRDAPHVTEFADMHALVLSPAGDRLLLWDTPGFGDSARLVRRMRQQGSPLGWLLSAVWDRWRDRPFWASQQALRHVQADSSVVLYLVNAAEQPSAAGYVAAEMELLAWIGKPVVVLLNQLGAPRTATEEAADLEAWRAHLAPHALVKAVLPMDAFSRCWLHELALWRAIEAVFDGPAALAMSRLREVAECQRLAVFDAAMQVLSSSLGRCGAAREAVLEEGGLRDRLRQLGAVVGLPRGDGLDPAEAAQKLLAAALQAELRESTSQLVALHGLAGSAQAELVDHLTALVDTRQRVPEGHAALLGGAVTGALAGLKADIASGGLTLGGGLLAGGLLGALGAAGLARGINVVRGTGQSWVAWNGGAMDALVQGALLRYLAVAHFGRGRGAWAGGPTPPHWEQAVTNALVPHRAALSALWAGRSTRHPAPPDEAERIAAAVQPILHAAGRAVLEQMMPRTWPDATHNPPA